MSENNKRARMNIYLVQELKDYVDSEAKNFGMSTSAYMTMIIQNYRMQNNALNSMSNAHALLNKLDEMQANSK